MPGSIWPNYKNLATNDFEGVTGQGGGFKNFRPLRLVNQELVRAPNRELPLFDGTSQWDRTLWASGDKPGTYYTWVRRLLATDGLIPDPVVDFRDQLVALCETPRCRRCNSQTGQSASR